MPNRVIVVPSRIEDVYRVAKALRAEDRAEIAAHGDVEARRLLRYNFVNSIMRRTYFVDGEIAAMTGLGGGLLSEVGQPYLVTTPVAARVPVSLIKYARANVLEMLQWRKSLTGEVLASYEKACRMLEMIGFTLSEPHAYGPKGVMFRTFSMRRAF